MWEAKVDLAQLMPSQPKARTEPETNYDELLFNMRLLRGQLQARSVQ